LGLFFKVLNHGTSVLAGLPKAPSSNQQQFFLKIKKKMFHEVSQK